MHTVVNKKGEGFYNGSTGSIKHPNCQFNNKNFTKQCCQIAHNFPNLRKTSIPATF